MLEKQVKEQVTAIEKQEEAKMLGTIVVPINVKELKDRLPKANYKEPSTKRSPSIGALEKHEELEESKTPGSQPRRYSIGREDSSKQERNYNKYEYSPVILARAEVNQRVNDKPIKIP